MTLNFIVDLKNWELRELYVDVVLATNVKSKCSNKYIISQTYSTNYIENLSVKLKYIINYHYILYVLKFE